MAQPNNFLGKNIFFLIGGALVVLCLGFGVGFFAVHFIRDVNMKDASQDLLSATRITHKEPYMTKQFFDDAFATASANQRAHTKPLPHPTGQIRGLTVNHHLLAAPLIARALLTAATQKEPSTILLISPNHFNAGPNFATSSRARWQTPYGFIEPNLDVIDALEKNGDFFVNEKPFEKEHGIYNIAAFIKKVFPHTTIVPLILKESLKTDKALALSNELVATLPADTLIILSADFSHYHTEAVANEHDRATLKVIETLSIASIRELDIDTHPGLEIFLSLMTQYGATQWHLLDHTNAQEIIGTEPNEGVTSYINGYFAL